MKVVRMKRYIFFLVLFVFCVHTRIKRPLLRRIIKSPQQKKAERPSNPVNKNIKQKKNVNREVVCVTPYTLDGKNSAVTYELNGGRFGDNLSSYCRAIWFAYHYGIPLFYEPFEYSQYLALDNYGLPMTKEISVQFKRRTIIPSYGRHDIKKGNGTLYIVKWKSRIPANWSDKEFIFLLKHCISAKSLITKIKIPSQHISVAVHIRTGGDYVPDRKIRARQPKRFVFCQFYIDQVKRIQSMFEGRDLYVHIFTDDAKPMVLMKQFKQQLGDENIIYGCRQQGNSFRSHVLEDFFGMMEFDCLIRPESLYSIYAERLGNHQVIISPVRTGTVGRRREVVVREIEIKEKTEQGYITKKIRV